MRLAAVADRLGPLITGGLVGTCAGLDAEALYSTRSPAEYEQVRADRREAYEYLPTDDGHWQRAFDAQPLLRVAAKSADGRLIWAVEGGHGPCGGLKVFDAVDHQ